MKTKSENKALKGTHNREVVGASCGAGTPLGAFVWTRGQNQRPSTFVGNKYHGKGYFNKHSRDSQRAAKIPHPWRDCPWVNLSGRK